MTFLNPLVLFGLVAAGIPLLIHLFNFRRPQKVDFSSLVFLRELQETTMQRVRIKQWLLLVLRTLAIAALVLAFARPTLKGSIAGVLGGDAQSATVVVIDNSLSMTVRDADGVLLDQARDAARGLLELFKSGDQIAVLRTGSPNPEDALWLKTRDAAAGEVADVAPSAAATTLREAISAAGQLLETTTFVNREVFVLSDLQSTGIGDSLTSEFPADVPVRLAQFGSEQTPNTGITSVRVKSQIIERNRPIHIEATIQSTGTSSELSVLSSVFLDDERAAQSEVDVPPNSSGTVEFVVTPRRTGWLDGTVEIEDDAFQEDNRRFFTVFVPETRRVLLAAGDGFESRYLNLALSAEVAPGRTRFDMDTVPASGLSSRRLTDYDVVVLAGASNLATGQLSALASYVAGGGGLMLFPSMGSDFSSLNDLLGRLGGGRIEGLLGGTEGPAAVIQGADTEHPLFEGMFQEERAAAAPRLEQLDVYRYASYGGAGAAELTLIRLSTGDPFMQEIPSGNGKALFVASLPTPAWSELPVRGLFVPLLYRSLSYLSAGKSPAGESLTIGDRVDIQIPGASESDLVEVVGGDEQAVPRQRPAYGGVVVSVGTEISTPGIYEVRIGDRLVGKLSANLDARESDLRTSDPDDAASRLRGSTAADIRGLPSGEGGTRFAAAVATMRTGVELWNVFLGVALVFLLAEMLVSRWWKPESSPS